MNSYNYLRIYILFQSWQAIKLEVEMADKKYGRLIDDESMLSKNYGTLEGG